MGQYVLMGIVFILAIKASIVYTEENTYTVLKIHDDSSITVKSNVGSSAFRFRLSCVDTPDLRQQPWGQKTLDRLRDLIPIKSQISLKLTIDRYQRSSAEVTTLNGINIIETLLSEGLIVLLPNLNNCSSYILVQKKATDNIVGVWSDSNFTLPFIWRQNLKE